MEQVRLKKFIRQPDRLPPRRLTARSFDIIATIASYHLVPTSLLLRLVPGNPRQTAQHLQMLFHRGMINRFAFPRVGSPGEFHYYLDSPATLQLLVDERGISPSALDWERVRRQKTEPLFDPFHIEEIQGRLLYLKHEAMISRFHALLELACRKSAGSVELAAWRQGPELHNLVQAPVMAFKSDPYHPEKKSWQEDDEKELLPHRPDAFFTLRFIDDIEGTSRQLHYFYEADRKRTTNPKKIWRKFRAHFYYVVKQDLHRQHYNVPRIRAVLFETLDRHWLEHLRKQSCHAAVYGDGKPPSPLFWFTTSEIFTKVISDTNGAPLPRYLHEPECILKPIWRTATEQDTAPLHRLNET